MSDGSLELFFDINFRTELLESLDWDEEACQAFLIYLKENLNKSNLNPNDLLSKINSLYGKDTYKIVKKLFNKLYIELGLHISNQENDNEH